MRQHRPPPGDGDGEERRRRRREGERAGCGWTEGVYETSGDASVQGARDTAVGGE